MLTLLQSLIQNFVTLYGQRDSQPLCAGVLLKVDKCVLAATRKLGRIEMNPKMLFYHLVTREMCGSMYYLAALYCLKYASPDQVDRMVCVCVCLYLCVWGGRVCVGGGCLYFFVCVCV